jgi:hypothetical protein
MDFSISVSMLNPSFEEIHTSKVYMRSLPFGQFPLKSQDRILLVRLYLIMLAEQFSKTDAATFISDLVFKPRYLPNYVNLNKQSDLPPNFNCFRSTRNSEAGRKYLNDIVAKQVKEFNDKDLDPAVRDIKFGDYVEMLVDFAVGRNNVALYLSKCF